MLGGAGDNNFLNCGPRPRGDLPGVDLEIKEGGGLDKNIYHEYTGACELSLSFYSE